MKGNSNLNTSGIYWLYINPWVCSRRNQTSTTAYFLFNRKSNQKKIYSCLVWDVAPDSNEREGGGMILIRNSTYICTGVPESISEVCAPTLRQNETQAFATHPLQGLVSPVGVWAGQKLWHSLKKSLICTSKGIQFHSVPHAIPLAHLNRDWQSRFSFWLSKNLSEWPCRATCSFVARLSYINQCG